MEWREEREEKGNQRGEEGIRERGRNGKRRTNRGRREGGMAEFGEGTE